MILTKKTNSNTRTRKKKYTKHNIGITKNKSQIHNIIYNIDDNIDDDSINTLFYKSSNPLKIVDNLKLFIQNNINNDKFANYISHSNKSDRIIKGFSGAKINVLQYNNKTCIVKYYNYNINNNIDKLIYYNKCIFINNKLNELLVNLVIKHIDKFIHNTNNVNLIKDHTLDLLDFSISNKGSLIILPLIGITIKNKYLTNLLELLLNNHIIVLKTLILNNNLDIISIYDEFMSEHIDEFYKTLRLLQKHIQLLHSDIKLTNIFIKFKTCSNLKYNILRENGFNIDFTLILGDLEKSSIELHNNKIITYSNHKFRTKLLNIITPQLYNYIKNECDNTKYNTKCPTIPIYDYDLLSFIIHLYTIYLQINNTILNYFNKVHYIVKTTLHLNTIKFNILLKILTDNQYIINKHYSYILNTIIAKYCKTLNGI